MNFGQSTVDSGDTDLQLLLRQKLALVEHYDSLKTTYRLVTKRCIFHTFQIRVKNGHPQTICYLWTVMLLIRPFMFYVFMGHFALFLFQTVSTHF